MENEGLSSVFSRPIRLAHFFRDSDMSSTQLRNVLLTGLLAVLAACSPAGEEGETNEAEAQAASLEGTNWQLVQLTVLGGFVFTPVDANDYVLNFRSGNRLTGTSDCNSINGSWLQENDALHFDPFVTTTALCPPGSLHNNLVLYLKDVEAYHFEDGHLVLATSTDGIAIEFESRD